MNIEIAPGWRLRSDGLQFVVQHVTEHIATRDYKNRSGEVVTRKGEPMESIEEHYFFHMSEVVRFMAEHELRQPEALENAVARLDAIKGVADRLAEIGPSRFLQETRRASS